MATVPMFAPDGTFGYIPKENVSGALQDGGQMGFQMTAPDGSTGYIPASRIHETIAAGGRFTTAAPAAPAPIDMTQSLAPKIVRGVATALPAVGGMAGGILGAPAGGIGAVGGAGVGSMLGEEGRQAINQGLAVNLPGNKYGEQPLTAEQSGKNILTAGAVGAGSQLLGGAAIGAGSRVIGNIAARQAAAETGAAAEGIAQAAPLSVTGKGLKFSLQDALNNISSKLTNVLQGSTGTASVSQTIAPIRNQAAQSTVSGVAASLDRSIEAAKEIAGITGDQATANQMLTFAQALVKPNKFAAEPAAVQQVLNNYAQAIYRQAGQAVRSLAGPEADTLLQQLTNLHAAKSAVKAYGPGSMTASLVSAATHPRTTAAISPFASAGAAYFKPENIINKIKAGASELIP